MNKKTTKTKKQNVKTIAPDMPALKPRLIAVNKLRPHPKNPKTHPDAQINGLGDAFDEFGITSVVVADENGTILAGEGRWRSAQKYGIKSIPVVTVTGWSEDKKLAFVIADNKWTELSGWNRELLSQNLNELNALQNMNFDTIGFFPQELSKYLEQSNFALNTSPQLGNLEFQIVVSCNDEDHQRELLDKFTEQGLQCRALMS